MRNFKLMGVAATAIALSLVLSGCFTLSVNPLYTPDVVVAHDEMTPNLAGVWGDPENPDEGTWQFVESTGNSYRLIIREEEQSLLVDPERDGIFEAHLLRLGDQLYLDLFPEEPDGVNEFYMAHVIPAHSFLKVELEGHVLSLAFFDFMWLRDAIKEGRIDIPHQRQDDLLVLVASTPELQELILAHGDEAFDEPEVVHRLQ